MKKRFLVVFLFSGLLFGLIGCGGIDYKTLEGYMQAGDCPLATGFLKEKEKAYGKNRRLLFLLDSAQINMLCGNYRESNEYFHSAEQLAEDLWTKSVTKEAASFLLNDYTRPYAGEDFERALINLHSAVNYLMLGEYDEALVECRRLDANLLMFNDKYGLKNVYKEDAFGRYLSGMVYEAVHELDDAYIDYYKAFKTFEDYGEDYGTPMPPILVEDLLRVAEATGRLSIDSSGVRSTDPDIQAVAENTKWLKHKEAERLGKVVLVYMNGKAPVKDEDVLFIPMKQGPVTLAFPKYVVTPPACRQAGLLLEPENGPQPENGSKVERVSQALHLVEDINSIAVKNLDDRKGRIIAKTIARAVVKQVAVAAVTKDETVRKLINIANIFIERADTRSWRTLPGEVSLSRVFLPEGRYNAYISLCGGQKRHIDSVEVKAGQTRFLIYETMY